jgi:hypothetical protein
MRVRPLPLQAIPHPSRNPVIGCPFDLFLSGVYIGILKLGMKNKCALCVRHCTFFIGSLNMEHFLKMALNLGMHFAHIVTPQQSVNFNWNALSQYAHSLLVVARSHCTYRMRCYCVLNVRVSSWLRLLTDS